MICPACGAKNRQGARFCHNCGRPVDEPESQDLESREQAAREQAAREQEADAGEVEIEPAEEPAEGVQDQEPGPEPAGGDWPEKESPAETGQEPVSGQEPTAPDTEPAAESAPPPETAPPDEAGTAPETGPEVDLIPPMAEEAVAVDLGTQDREEEARPEPASEPEAATDAADVIAEPDSDLEAAVEFEEDELLGAFWREEQEPLEPATAGTLIAGRYLLLEVLDAGQDEVLYLARDLQRCWQCGAEVDLDEAFCSHCGAAQEQPSQSAPEVRLVEVRPPGDVVSSGLKVQEHLTYEDRHFVVLAEPEIAPEPTHEEPEPESIRLVVGQRSDPGQMRELNEDSVLTIHVAPTYEGVTSPVLGFFAVADGMGGHEGGEIASKLALQVLGDYTLRTIILPDLAGDLILDEEMLAHLRRAVLAANDAVFLARQKRGIDMGTTLTVVLVRDRRLLLAHVGDCRAYRWSEVGLEQLTTDHSVVASMIAHGQVSPEEIYTHPHRSVIYRCVGDQPTVEVDGDRLPLEPGHRIVICSDGLWEMVHTEGIADVMMQEANPQVACDLLVRLANAAGGEDNISVVIVQVEAA